MSEPHDRELLPPEHLHFVGRGDFAKTGNTFFRFLTDIGGLKADDAVLDVGCGVGRIAIPLTGYLRKRYEGFDVVPEGIEWCQENITPRYPNFHFQLADIHNNRYNPEGEFRASEYMFPYEDESFDFVFLASVFTHMFPADMENYLSEVSRVLKRDGRCLITYFLLNGESRAAIEAGKSNFPFRFQLEGCVTANPRNPEAAIAYEEITVRNLNAEAGLDTASINFGRWSGRHGFTGQDIVVAVKR